MASLAAIEEMFSLMSPIESSNLSIVSFISIAFSFSCCNLDNSDCVVPANKKTRRKKKPRDSAKFGKLENAKREKM